MISYLDFHRRGKPLFFLFISDPSQDAQKVGKFQQNRKR